MSTRSHPSPRGVAVLVLVALMAAACSGAATSKSTATAAAPPANTTPSTGQAGTGAADPCALVTAADAQAAMGLPVATTKRNDDVYNVCQYTSADGDHWVAISLSDGSGDKAQFDSAWSQQAVPVTGVGSDAYFSAGMGTLAVWRNGTFFMIQIEDHGDTSPAQIQAAATKVALAVLGRL